MSTLVIYVGGFTASHQKMPQFHSHFENRGVQYFAVQLPGHRESVERYNNQVERSNAKNLARYTASDWENKVVNEYLTLAGRKDVERIIFVGHSMGAYLSILAALKQVNIEKKLLKLAGVAMISAPFEGKLNRLYAFSLKLAKIDKIPFLGSIPYPSKAGHGSNKYVVPKSVKEFVQVLRKGRAELPNVKVPILLFNFQEDPSVQVESAEAILGCLPDEIREKSKSIVLEGKLHTPDEENQARIAKEILEFFDVA